MRRRIILEPGKRDVEIIVNQVRRLVLALTRMISIIVAVMQMVVMQMMMMGMVVVTTV